MEQSASAGQITIAQESDLDEIVRIYNASIKGRLATADTQPVTVESRRQWFRDHRPEARPLWILREQGKIAGWLSLQSFYGRPAYKHTVEVSVYVNPDFQRTGVAKQLLGHLLKNAAKFEVKTCLAFIFDHNQPSLDLFKKFGFVRWGHLPAVAMLDDTWASVEILGLKILEKS